MITQYGVRFPNGHVAPVPSLSSARGARNVWGRKDITTEIVQRTPDGWRLVPEGSNE